MQLFSANSETNRDPRRTTRTLCAGSLRITDDCLPLTGLAQGEGVRFRGIAMLARL
jgi:hypothetical protein